MAISDLRGGELVSGEFIVREKSLQDFRSKPGRYLTLMLADETGQIEGRAWENAETLAKECAVGEVVYLQGQAEEYKGRVQLKIVKLEARPGAAVSKYLPTLEEARIRELAGKFKQLVGTVQDRHLRALLDKLFGDAATWEKFCAATAARSLHSAYVGGLLEHTVHVATLCEAVCSLYSEINRDLLISAALLHDIGKMDAIELRGVVFEYTEPGKLIGEPVLGERRLSAVIGELPGFPRRHHLMLSHLLLSHHGEYQFGAPVLPSCLEAFVLHHVDNLEAKTNGVLNIMKRATDPEKVWSEFSRSLERSIYLPRLEPGEEA